MMLSSFLSPYRVGSLPDKTSMLTQLPTRSTTDDSPTLEVQRSAVVEFFSGLARFVLLLVLVTAPWFFGGVYTNIQYLLYVGVLAALTLWIPAGIWQLFTVGLKTNLLPLAMIPLMGALALGQYQLRPQTHLPSAAESVQNAIESAIAKSNDEDERQRLAKSSLIQSLQTGYSIAPVVTRFEMNKLIIVLATFFLGTQLFATPKTQLWLWGAFALNGAALAFFGICQQLNWNGKLFWTFPLRYGGFPFSSFINRNNAAGYLCICLAGALGLLIAICSESLSTDVPGSRLQTRIRHQRNRLQYSITNLLDFLGGVSAAQLAAGSLVILITTGIVVAASRGGWVALIAATVVTTLFVSRLRNLPVLGFVCAVGLFSVGLVAWTGLGDRIGQRWTRDGSVDAITSDGRWAHWRDTINAVFDFPVSGTGYGTYQFAYLPYQSHASISHKRFYNADNQFLEWLVEGGLVGALFVFLSILLIVRAVAALLNRSQFDAVGLVGLFAIVSQCVSACFDFGPTIPANMLALAVLFGSIAGHTALLVSLKQIGPSSWGLAFPVSVPKVIIPTFGIAVLIVGVFSMHEVKAAATTHSISQNLPKLDSPDVLDEESVSKLIDDLSSAVSAYPGDPDAHLALADLWVFKFRLTELQIALKQQPWRQPSDAWLQTNPVYYYEQISAWERTGQIERVQMLVETPSIQAYLVPAYNQLLLAQTACPLVPDVSRLLAMLSFVVNPEQRHVQAELMRAILLAPSSPVTNYEVGQLAYFAELTDLAFACWKKSLELSPRYLLDIHKTLSGKLSLDSELERVIPDSAELQLRLADALTGKDEQANRDKLANRALELLSNPTNVLPEADRRYYFGKAQLLLGEADDAIQEYRHALELSPYQIEWRIELTYILLKHKSIKWALREAETCVAIAPEQKRLQEMVRDLQGRLAAERAKPITNRKIQAK